MLFNINNETVFNNYSITSLFNTKGLLNAPSTCLKPEPIKLQCSLRNVMFIQLVNQKVHDSSLRTNKAS